MSWTVTINRSLHDVSGFNQSVAIVWGLDLQEEKAGNWEEIGVIVIGVKPRVKGGNAWVIDGRTVGSKRPV